MNEEYALFPDQKVSPFLGSKGMSFKVRNHNGYKVIDAGDAKAKGVSANLFGSAPAMHAATAKEGLDKSQNLNVVSAQCDGVSGTRPHCDRVFVRVQVESETALSIRESGQPVPKRFTVDVGGEGQNR